MGKNFSISVDKHSLLIQSRKYPEARGALFPCLQSRFWTAVLA